MFYQSHINKAFHLSPACHKFFMNIRSGVRITCVAITSRCMIIRERPVYKVKIQIIQMKIFQRLCTGKKYISFSMHIIPYLGNNE